MNTFRYDATSIEYFDGQDLGSIGDAPTSTVDRGTNFSDLIVENVTEGVVNNEFIVDTGTDFIVNEVTSTEVYGIIVWTETTYPFGAVSINGGDAEQTATVVFTAKPEPIVLREKAVVIRKQAWTGSGTLFELANGLERMVAPYIGGSGPLPQFTIGGAVDDSSSVQYTDETFKTYGSDVDNGQVTAAVGSSIGNGQVSDIATDGEIDYGDIIQSDEHPFGSLKLRGFKVTSNRFSAYTGSGSLSVLSGGSDQLDEPSTQIYVVGRNQATGQFIRTDVIGLNFSGSGNEAFVYPNYNGSGGLFSIVGGLESKVYDYNSGSIATFTVGTDGGLVTNNATTTDEYGQVVDQAVSGEFDYGEVTITQTRQPLTGLFKITGGDIAHSNPRAFAGSGAIKTYKGKAVVNAGQASDFAFLPHWRGRGGITVANHVIPDAFARIHIGSGSLFEIGQKDERTVFTYNSEPPTGNVQGSIGLSDNGTVEQSAGTNENYGTVTGPFTNGILDYGQLNPQFNKFGNLNITGRAVTPIPRSYNGSGLLNTVGGRATIQFAEPAIQVYNYGLSPNQGSAGEFLKIGGGMSSIIIIKGSWIGAGTISNIGKNDEKATFDYTEESIEVVLDPVDGGFITNAATTNENYGVVTEPAVGETSYGSVTTFITNNPFGKLFEWTGGDIAHSNPRAYTGATAEVRITGGYSNLQFVSQAGESTALFNIANGLPEGNTYSKSVPFIASGSLFSHGIKTESATVAYNESSVAESYGYTDAGSVTDSHTVAVDHGQITAPVPPSNIDDYGNLVLQPGDENPLGKLFEIQGSADEKFFPKFIWNRFSPAIRIYNEQQDPADFRFTPHWRTDTTTTNPPRISNGPGGEFHTYAQSRPFIASGSLFSHGIKNESATVDYNESSIVEFNPGGDYGSITDNPTTTNDYGTVTTNIHDDGEADLGQLVITETEYPLTGLFRLTGAAPKVQFIRGPYVVKEGGFRLYNEQQDPADFSFRPHWRSRPYEQGKLTGNSDTSRSRPFVGKGRLFGLGDKYESATFDYNGGTIVYFDPSGNYGSITDNPTTTDDYGQIVDQATAGEIDNGLIIITETRQSAGGLFNLGGGNSDVQYIRGPYVVKPRSLRIYNEQQDPADFKFSPHWRSRPYEQGKLTGDSDTSRSRDFVGSGSLFHIGQKEEATVYRYSTDSVVEFNPLEDYGSVTNNATTTNEFGSITTTTPGGEIDFGQVLITQTRQSVTGLFRITGGDKGHKQTFSEISQTVKISLSGTAVEAFTSGAGESTALFTYDGSVEEKFTRGPYFGSGSLFEIGFKDEKAVFSYNSSSVVSFGTPEDDGSVTSAHSTQEDYGTLTGVETGAPEDYGDLVLVPGKEKPYGLFRFSGVAVKREINSHVGSGSLFTTKGATEVVGFNPAEQTVLFRFSGAAVETHTEHYTGSGLIKIKEETPLAPNSHIRFRPHWRSRHLLGTPAITGAAEVDFRGVYISKGVFIKVYTHDKDNEWRRYRPSPRYVNSIYGKIGGSAFVNGDGGTSKINVYGYYGDDRDPGTSGSLFGIGGGAESSSIIPPTNTVLFRTSGTSPSKWNPAWTSRPVGSPRLFGTPDLQLRFNIFTNPEIEKFKVYGDVAPSFQRRAFGGGKLTTFGGGAEVVGFNPVTDTRAFKFSGSPTIRIRFILFQFGTFSTFGGGAESKAVEVPQSTVLFVPSGSSENRASRAFEGSGSEIISGQSIERRTSGYTGEGSLFATNGSAESKTASIPESTVLFTASGDSQNASVRTKIGTGSTTVSGDSTDVRSRTHVGSGSLFSIGGAVESATVAPESTGLFEFKGSAEPVIRTHGFAGSGSLFSIGGGIEVAAVAPESTGLFTVSGEAQAPFARTKIGSGTAFVSGDAEARATRIYAGEGQLSTFGGGAEVVGFNPAEETVLYEFGGTAEPVIRTRGFNGSGSANVSNESDSIRSRAYAGSGTFSTFGGGAESRTIDVENTTLFVARGTAAESFTKGNYTAKGDTNISGEATDIKSVVSNVGSGTTFVSGEKIEKQTDNYVGSGTLFGLASGTESRAISIDTPVSTNLFKVTGNNPGSVTRITQPGTLKISVQGEAIPVLKLFSPIRIFSTII